MEHIPFEMICRIADQDMPVETLSAYQEHIEICRICRQEIEMQKSIKRESKTAPLTEPESGFTDAVLEMLVPSKQKKWYERVLQYSGNIFVMAFILAILGYIFSFISSIQIPIERQADIQKNTQTLKTWFDAGYESITNCSMKIFYKDSGLLSPHIVLFILLAVIILIFLDNIVSRLAKK